MQGSSIALSIFLLRYLLVLLDEPGLRRGLLLVAVLAAVLLPGVALVPAARGYHGQGDAHDGRVLRGRRLESQGLWVKKERESFEKMDEKIREEIGSAAFFYFPSGRQFGRKPVIADLVDSYIKQWSLHGKVTWMFIDS